MENYAYSYGLAQNVKGITTSNRSYNRHCPKILPYNWPIIDHRENMNLIAFNIYVWVCACTCGYGYYTEFKVFYQITNIPNKCQMNAMTICRPEYFQNISFWHCVLFIFHFILDVIQQCWAKAFSILVQNVILYILNRYTRFRCAQIQCSEISYWFFNAIFNAHSKHYNYYYLKC